MDSTKVLNEYIVSLSNKSSPKLLFIPTASDDAEGYIERIHEYFGEIGCIVSSLCLITHTYNKKSIRSMIKDADIIYVGGGDTVSMMENGRSMMLISIYMKPTMKGKYYLE